MFWYVYIVACKNHELYVGCSKDVEERVVQHNDGKACRYTRYRRPVKLIYKEKCGNYNEARKRERQVKKYSRMKKLNLMKS